MHRKGALQPPMMIMLGKNYWADSECALNAVATAVIFHIDHVSPPVSPFIRFSPLSLRPGVVGVCFEVPGCNVMPEWLLSVISGILAGGIPGFRIELCCFHHPLTWPLRVIPCFLCFASCSVAILNDTQDVIMHVFPIAGFPLLVAIPLLCVFCLFWFGCGCVFLVCLVSFVSGCCFLVLAGTARWTVYRSTTSTFVAIDKLTALHDNYNSSFCCDWTSVTTWRKPWRRWTKKKVHGLIHARDDSIVSSRWYGSKNKGKNQKNHQAIPEGEWSNKSTMRKPGIPPARIPEITWRKPIRQNNSPIVTSKQTTTTPRRNESGEKKSETDSETRANVRRANVKRTVKQPCGCAQSPLSTRAKGAEQGESGNLWGHHELVSPLGSCLTIDLLASCFVASPCCFLWVMCWGLQCSACSLRPALVVLLWPASCGPLFCCSVFVCVVAGSFGRVFVVCCCFPLVALSCFVFWCSGLVPRGLLSPCPATGEDPRKS